MRGGRRGQSARRTTCGRRSHDQGASAQLPQMQSTYVRRLCLVPFDTDRHCSSTAFLKARFSCFESALANLIHFCRSTAVIRCRAPHAANSRATCAGKPSRATIISTRRRAVQSAKVLLVNAHCTTTIKMSTSVIRPRYKATELVRPAELLTDMQIAAARQRALVDVAAKNPEVDAAKINVDMPVAGPAAARARAGAIPLPFPVMRGIAHFHQLAMQYQLAGPAPQPARIPLPQFIPPLQPGLFQPRDMQHNEFHFYFGGEPLVQRNVLPPIDPGPVHFPQLPNAPRAQWVQAYPQPAAPPPPPPINLPVHRPPQRPNAPRAHRVRAHPQPVPPLPPPPPPQGLAGLNHNPLYQRWYEQVQNQAEPARRAGRHG